MTATRAIRNRPILFKGSTIVLLICLLVLIPASAYAYTWKDFVLDVTIGVVTSAGIGTFFTNRIIASVATTIAGIVVKELIFRDPSNGNLVRLANVTIGTSVQCEGEECIEPGTKYQILDINKVREYGGRMKITVVNAIDVPGSLAEGNILLPKPFWLFVPDPYVEIWQGQYLVGKTKTKNNNSNPMFGESFAVDFNQASAVTLVLKDYDAGRNDNVIGSIVFSKSLILGDNLRFRLRGSGASLTLSISLMPI